MKNLKNLDAFQAETLTRGRQRRLSRRKAGPLGGLRGVPVLAETQAARRRAAVSVMRRPRGGEDAEEGFPGWGTNGGANPILAGCLFLATFKIKRINRRPTQAAPVSRGKGGPPEGDERRGRQQSANEINGIDYNFPIKTVIFDAALFKIT